MIRIIGKYTTDAGIHCEVEIDGHTTENEIVIDLDQWNHIYDIDSDHAEALTLDEYQSRTAK